MAKKLFVGNLSYNTTEEELSQKIAEFGKAESVKIITDKFTGKSRGFAFIEYDDSTDIEKIVEAINGMEVDGRPLAVQEARPQEKRERPAGRYNNNSGYGNRY
jgi:cold-inducible RNA-binding protein